MIKKVTLKNKNNSETMDVETYVRWLCLIEALGFISDKSKKINFDAERNLSWIKPKPIQKYIKERYPAMLHDFRIDENLDAYDNVTL
jgi:hypothetical protein